MVRVSVYYLYYILIPITFWISATGVCNASSESKCANTGGCTLEANGIAKCFCDRGLELDANGDACNGIAVITFFKELKYVF
jgi:hypothetical protein